MAGVSLAVATRAKAVTLSVADGNVLVDGVAITTDHSESDPVLSPDGEHVVFTHYGKTSAAMESCSFAGADPRSVSLWIVDLDGRNPRKLLDGHGDSQPEKQVCDLTDKAFSSDGTLLYFETPAWVTSDAIHVFDLRTSREHFIVDGSALVVLATYSDPAYRDDFIAVRHSYFVFGGSYNWAYLFKPDGQVVGPLGDAGSFGETLDISAADDACRAK